MSFFDGMSCLFPCMPVCRCEANLAVTTFDSTKSPEKDIFYHDGRTTNMASRVSNNMFYNCFTVIGC
jgi:hypothetical protein